MSEHPRETKDRSQDKERPASPAPVEITLAQLYGPQIEAYLKELPAGAKEAGAFAEFFAALEESVAYGEFREQLRTAFRDQWLARLKRKAAQQLLE